MAKALKDIRKDIQNVNAKFPLATLPSKKQFLDYEDRVDVAKKKAAEEEYDSWDDSESPELSPLRRTRCAPEDETIPPEGEIQDPPLPEGETPR